MAKRRADDVGSSSRLHPRKGLASVDGITVEQIMDVIASNRLSEYDLRRIALLLPPDILPQSQETQPLHVAIHETCKKLGM